MSLFFLLSFPMLEVQLEYIDSLQWILKHFPSQWKMWPSIDTTTTYEVAIKLDDKYDSAVVSLKCYTYIQVAMLNTTSPCLTAMIVGYINARGPTISNCQEK